MGRTNQSAWVSRKTYKSVLILVAIGLSLCTEEGKVAVAYCMELLVRYGLNEGALGTWREREE